MVVVDAMQTDVAGAVMFVLDLLRKVSIYYAIMPLNTSITI